MADLSVQGTKKGNGADADIMKRLDKDLREAKGQDGKPLSFAKVALEAGLVQQSFLKYGVGKETKTGMKVAGKEEGQDVVDLAVFLYRITPVGEQVDRWLGKETKQEEMAREALELAVMLKEDPSLLGKIAKEIEYEAKTSNLDLAEYTGNRGAMRFYDGYNGVKITGGVIGSAGGVGSALKIAKGLKAGGKIASNAIPKPKGSNAASNLGSMTGKSPIEMENLLKKEGFSFQSQSQGGYRKYRHPDGSEVQIRPNGEVVRLGPKQNAGQRGEKAYRNRYDQNGEIIEYDPSGKINNHNTGEKIDTKPYE